jgi:hypothetical protein
MVVTMEMGLLFLFVFFFLVNFCIVDSKTFGDNFGISKIINSEKNC